MFGILIRCRSEWSDLTHLWSSDIFKEIIGNHMLYKPLQQRGLEGANFFMHFLQIMSYFGVCLCVGDCLCFCCAQSWKMMHLFCPWCGQNYSTVCVYARVNPLVSSLWSQNSSCCSLRASMGNASEKVCVCVFVLDGCILSTWLILQFNKMPNPTTTLSALILPSV